MARVLVVDDEAPMREMLRMAVEMDGHGVSEAYDTESAINAYLADPPELMILDLAMPGGGGCAVVRKLANSGLILCPTLIVTGFIQALEDDIPALLPRHEVIEKPFQMERFRAAIARILAP